MKVAARDNPFASDRVERFLSFEPEWIGQDWDGMLGRLKQLDYRAAIVGPHGSGKTTLLSGLKDRLEKRGVEVLSLFLNDEKKSFSAEEWQVLDQKAGTRVSTAECVITVDGAEQLTWIKWGRLKRVAKPYKGLVISQHTQGRLPVWLETDTSPEMLRSFIARLAPDFDCSDGEIEKMFHSTEGNLRESLWVCYDKVSGSPCLLNS